MEKSRAGFWIRLGANILDGLLLGVPIGILAVVLGLSVGNKDIITTVITALYYLLLPVLWYGYTVGKRACSIRIERIDGEKIGFRTMVLRHIVGFIIVYGLTFGIATIVSAFMVGLREDKRAIHDFIAGTCVVYAKPED
ncbi:RDD family protein [Virgibacillus siamensis]|uniref:RDD family protein n=1 Tax=Virgibacillus siamensis TaxID=480071 RepID=A0ABP3QKX4_9BACI